MASLHLANEIFKLIYPVGSIYLSDNATNPSSKFGGTWVQLKDHFLYAGSSFSSGNGTGTATNSHTLTIDQIPSHNHSIQVGGTRLDANGDSVFRAQVNTPTSGGNFWNIGLARTGLGSHDSGITSTGGGKGHSHNIPYQSIYVWRRTA